MFTTAEARTVRTFDFYEFVGILAPGATALLGIGLIYSSVWPFFNERVLSVGDLGLFLILAYVAGHLVQAVGNFVESLWWRVWGGWPTDWVRSNKGNLLAPAQLSALEDKVKTILGLEVDTLQQLPARQWSGITRQVYAAVSSAGHATRVDTFNGNYGLCRGLAASFLTLCLLTLVSTGFNSLRAEALLLVASAVALYRMTRFGRHYARELFVQFVQLSPEESDPTNASQTLDGSSPT